MCSQSRIKGGAEGASAAERKILKAQSFEIL